MIKCNTCGCDFKQLPSKHLLGQGCPKCRIPKGERIIEYYLLEHKYEYVTQKSFNGCVYKRKLKFDFYLPEYNLCIEYDGIQHFEAIDYFGGEKRLKIQKTRDQIKNEYCKENSISLLRIRYNEDIEEKLNQIL